MARTSEEARLGRSPPHEGTDIEDFVRLTSCEAINEPPPDQPTETLTAGSYSALQNH